MLGFADNHVRLAPVCKPGSTVWNSATSETTRALEAVCRSFESMLAPDTGSTSVATAGRS